MFVSSAAGGAVVTLAAAVLLAGCGAATHQDASPAQAPVTSHAVTAPPRSVAPADVAAPAPAKVAATTPCTTNSRRQYVFVSLGRQHMWMCERHRVAKDTAITTGMLGAYTETPTGTFHIQGRDRHTVLTLNTGATYHVQYWIPFDAPLFGFHDSPWQNFPYGSARYRTDGSHGCVHVPLSAIRFLYNWADTGTAVRIKA